MTTGEIVATVEGVGAFAIASDGRSIWTLETDGSLKRISPSTNGITANISLQTTGLDSIAVGGGDVWATSSADGVVWRITVAPQPVSRTIQLETGAAAVAYHEGSVWVANGVRGTVSRIDPATNAVVATVAVGNTPYGLAVDDGGAWVTVQGGGEAAASPSTVEGIEALPSSFCGSPVYGGEGTPDMLVVSDLPLQGGSRFTTVQMEQAIEYVFRQRGFQAGEHRVAYQSCDDSLASTGLFDFDKCAANAKAYAENRAGRRRHRNAQLGVRGGRDPRAQRGHGRAAGDDLAVELAPRPYPAVARRAAERDGDPLPDRQAQLRPCVLDG